MRVPPRESNGSSKKPIASKSPNNSTGDAQPPPQGTAKSSGKGWDVLPSESNGVLLHRRFWEALNGFDEGFGCPGGGLANLDLWKRICEWPGARVRMLQGEATFHQFHGGATTGSATSRRDAFDAEYEALRGVPFKRPDVAAEYLPPAGEPAARDDVLPG